MKRFNDNPFDFISDEQFEVIKSEGFTRSPLETISDLKGEICYVKEYKSPSGSNVIISITEQGIVVDYDRDDYRLWWFIDGEYEGKEFNYSTFKYEKVIKTRFKYSFEEAWDEMIDYCLKL